MLLVFGACVEHVEVPVAELVDLEHGSQVATAVTVVRRAPDRAQLAIKQLVVAGLAQLVGPQNVRAVVSVQKSVDNVFAERVACATRTDTELGPCLIGIAPHEIGHRAVVGDFPEPVNDLDLVYRL